MLNSSSTSQTYGTKVSLVRPCGANVFELEPIAIMSYGYVPDEENGLGSALFDKSGPSIEFAEQEVRLGFIRKVFGEYKGLLYCVAYFGGV